MSDDVTPPKVEALRPEDVIAATLHGIFGCRCCPPDRNDLHRAGLIFGALRSHGWEFSRQGDAAMIGHYDERFDGTSYAVPCPKCGAFPGFKCRTLTTGRSTDTHSDRHRDAYLMRQLPVVSRRSVSWSSAWTPEETT